MDAKEAGIERRNVLPKEMSSPCIGLSRATTHWMSHYFTRKEKSPNQLTVPAFVPDGSWNAFMLNRLPGPAVHPVRPDRSMSQRVEGLVALPGSRQLMPMMAIGSGGSELASSWLMWSTWSSELFLLRSLSNDHSDEEWSPSVVSFSALSLKALSVSLNMMTMGVEYKRSVTQQGFNRSATSL
jgi:hypothetical protein